MKKTSKHSTDFFQKTFFPKLELLIQGAAYLRVFMVFSF